MSLLTKPIVGVEWKDVQAFCNEQIPEGAFLDYKQDFPSNLEKTLAAMANTLGGLILIGVKEDKETRPELPVKGIPFKKGLSERVTSIVLGNITPPFIPEVAVPLDPSGRRAVVVVRIPQSHQTPHAIGGNTQVYYRTGNRNQPEALASVDRIGWLISGRRKSESFKEALYKQAEARFGALHSKAVAATEKTENSPKVVQAGWLSLSFCPLYPKERFKDSPVMYEVYRKLEVNEYFRTGARFPLPDWGNWRFVQDGLVRHDSSDRSFHFELNCFGLYFYMQSIICEIPEDKRNVIRSSEIFCRLDEFVDSAVKFYEQLGYWGQLEFRANLEAVQNGEWVPYPYVSGGPRNDSLDADVRFSSVVLAGSLRNEKPRLILEAAQQMAWAFNWGLTAEGLDRYYVETKRESVLFPDPSS